jgi:hypothetical protein
LQDVMGDSEKMDQVREELKAAGKVGGSNG